MRGINAEAQANAPFLTLFLGSALVALVLGIAVLALVPLVVTVAFNIPLNDRLAGGAVPWPDYFRVWTVWNHVRTVAPLIGSVLMVIGLRLH